ncbi:thiolase family protein [Streptomyces sp. NPDC051218]|uniref:thiolase family protein n=1 Tax=Streptomyces sp. NPDC051218 TaxID=3365645 RepID=UPI0037AB9ABC
MDETVVVVSAVRTAIGRRGRGLADVHPTRLLGSVQRAALAEAGLDPHLVGQVVGGVVAQVGEQAFNAARTAWLAEGLPQGVAATTVDAQCGSSQQALTLATGLVASGITDVALACGVESMSRIPIGSNFRKDFDLGRPVPKAYQQHYEFLNQYQAAERIAEHYGITRRRADELGVTSQERAAHAWAEGRFDSQIVKLEVETEDGRAVAFSRDEGLRATTLEGLAGLKPAVDGGIHTAGTASQISDGASAVLLTTERRARELGLTPLARVVDSLLIGVDPVMMLLGPHTAAPKLLERNNLTIDDVDLIEINEAFASVVLSFQDETKADPAKINPNGGAIAHGHPLGATGCVLTTKAVHELRRTGDRYGLVTMCCGGGVGTATLLERL